MPHHKKRGAGVFGVIIIGLGIWGSFALGGALGLAGAAAFFSGAGIIVGGVAAIVLLGLAIRGIHRACQSSRVDHYQQHFQPWSVNDDVINTRHIMQSMPDNGLRESASAPPLPQADFQQQPQAYQDQFFRRPYEPDIQPSAPTLDEIRGSYSGENRFG